MAPRYNAHVKLYVSKFAPNPRRVVIYLREKQLEIDRVIVDAVAGDHRTPEMLAKNPLGLLPILELDDGSCLTESLAICHYLEELHPEPNVIGETAIERARICEATRIAELGLLAPAALAFQNAMPFFAKRLEQSAAVADQGRQQFSVGGSRIDQLLGDKRPHLAGDRFSLADITALCAIDFGKPAGCLVDPAWHNLATWLTRVRERPSCRRGLS